VTDQSAPAVARVCARLDGIPLAIELAAARVRVLSVEQLLARLEDRFRLLTGGSRIAPERHQTLRAAVDWSYDLLSAQEQTLFARLSVFAGGWALEAAEQVCAGDETEGSDVLDLLTGLVDKSLVAVDERPDGAARYRLLETLRQYAWEHLTAGGAEAIQARHAAYYFRLAEQAEQVAPGSARLPRTAWRDRFWQEVHNLRAAIRWLLERGLARGGLGLARVSVAAGEEIVRQGEPGDRFYIVEAGAVEVVDEDDGRVVNTLGSGAAFGEIAFLTGQPRTATVRAVEPTALQVLTIQDFRALLADDARRRGGTRPRSRLVPDAPAPAGPLSLREREVAALVAQGLTNRQIAARLVVTERTAATHVEHILAKLALTSRVQIGLWAVAHGLGPSPAVR
jgi:CRP-like cAMP-binding protein